MAGDHAQSTRFAHGPIAPRFYAGADGVTLAYREIGAGRDVLLLHGFFSDAATNWIKYGHAAAIAEQGFRVVMPDLRAHGDSAKPHDAAAYRRDVLADDGEALIAHLGLHDYDLGGYSLGGRTVARMIARGAMPRRVVIAGMGLEGLTDTGARSAHFRNILTNLGQHERGSPEWMAEAFLKTTGGDPAALLHILDTFVDTPIATLSAIDRPVLVIAGEDDDDNGSAHGLAALIPDARYESVPGGHMSAVVKRELGTKIAAFLAA